MNNICYVVAMRAEAEPFIKKYGIKEVEDFFAPLPCQLYEGMVNGMKLSVVLNGQQHGGKRRCGQQSEARGLHSHT